MKRLKTIDLGDWHNSKLDPLRDLTVYQVVGLDKFNLTIEPQEAATWIAKEDCELDGDEFPEEYGYVTDGESTGYLLINGYCGEIKATLTDTIHIPVTLNVKINSRFAVDYGKMAKAVRAQNESKNDYEAMLTNKYGTPHPAFMGQLYDMPILYEVFARHCIRKKIAANNWRLCEGNDATKYVCAQDCYWCVKDEKTDKRPQAKTDSNTNEIPDCSLDVYLQGQLIPDIILHNEKTKEYVILDVKYKKGTYNSGTRSDRFQILAYAYKWNCQKVGHIFPEQRSDNPLIIQCGKTDKTLTYQEFSLAAEEDADIIIKTYCPSEAAALPVLTG